MYRFKNHVFCDTHHGFDLPKSLAVSSIAVRILHTHYDHVSPLWLQCQRVPRLEVLDSQELTQHSQDNAGEPEEEEKEAKEEPNVTAEEETLPDERNVGKLTHKRMFYSTVPTGDPAAAWLLLNVSRTQENNFLKLLRLKTTCVNTVPWIFWGCRKVNDQRLS